MDVEVCRAEPDRVTRVRLQLPDGANVGDAVARSGLAAASGVDAASGYAVFGRRATPETLLHDGDRVELLRPLKADPKEARRRRADKKLRGQGPGRG